MDDADTVLVQRAQAGDQAAFAVLAARHGPRMARMVRALGIPRDEVEDVTQMALIATWRGLGSFEPGRPFAAWACVVAANKARDWRRSLRRRRDWLGADPLDSAEALRVPDPQTLADNPDRVRLRQVAQALEQMPDKFRTVLVLVTTAELTQAEAAQALGISRKAVEMRVARARALLLKLIGPDAGSGAVQPADGTYEEKEAR